jgi:hypothetical protein
MGTYSQGSLPTKYRDKKFFTQEKHDIDAQQSSGIENCQILLA